MISTYRNWLAFFSFFFTIILNFFPEQSWASRVFPLAETSAGPPGARKMAPRPFGAVRYRRRLPLTAPGGWRWHNFRTECPNQMQISKTSRRRTVQAPLLSAAEDLGFIPASCFPPSHVCCCWGTGEAVVAEAGGGCLGGSRALFSTARKIQASEVPHLVH